MAYDTDLGSGNAQRGLSREPTSRVDSFPSTLAEEQCDACEKQDNDLAYCNICNINYCPSCWVLQAPHRKQRLASGKAKHEKTELALARKIRNVLLPSNDIQALTRLHEDDAQTAWFGESLFIPILYLTKCHCVRRRATPRRRGPNLQRLRSIRLPALRYGRRMESHRCSGWQRQQNPQPSLLCGTIRCWKELLDKIADRPPANRLRGLANTSSRRNGRDRAHLRGCPSLCRPGHCDC